jgi:hypothetical protein
VAIVRSFLEQFYDPHLDALGGRWVGIGHAAAGDTELVSEWRPCTVAGLDQLAEVAVELTDQRRSVWLHHALRACDLGRWRRGGGSDCVEIVALPADIDVAGDVHQGNGVARDVAAVRQLLERFPLPPSIRVATGNGIHAWHLLAEPVDGAERDELLLRHGATWGRVSDETGVAADSVFSVAQMMRLAGTVNWRDPNNPKPVCWRAAEPLARYEVRDLLERLDPAPAPFEPGPANPFNEGAPGTAYNAGGQAVAVQLLTSLGFHNVKQRRGGSVSLHAPHRTPREQIGAEVKPDGKIFIYSATQARLLSARTRGDVEPWPERRGGYDAFGLYARVHHGGNMSAAARQLNAEGWGEQRTKVTTSDNGRGGAPPGVDPETGEIRDARQLPERFWTRPAHAAMKDAAFLVGVSPEAMVFTAIGVVAAHIPPAIIFPGKRRGVPNVLAAIIGPPGHGKGTVLDRALELVRLPGDARKYKPGTAQGLVKKFHKETTKAEREADPGLPMFVRHYGPVILRVDEVAKFAAATGSNTNGQNLLAELKSAVFGEALGQSVATDEKNLQCEERSYRLVGLLGVASGVAGPLFDDIDGGLPQRVLFANLLRDGQQPAPTLEPFDDLATDDVVAADGGQYVPLPPLQWRAPAVNGRQSFADSQRVAERVAVLLRTRWDLLDAHVPYLTHAVAAVLAYLDGRWTIQPADLTLAGDVVDVSRATRAELLDGLARSAATGRKRQADERRAEAVETAGAVHVQKVDLDRVDYARRVVAEVRERTADKGGPPTVRELYRNKNDTGAWRLAYDEALGRGWLREERQQTEAGGSPRRAVIVTDEAP